MWDDIDKDPLDERGVNRAMKLGFMAVANPSKVAKATLRAVERNKREVRLPKRNGIKRGIKWLFNKEFMDALLTGIDIRQEAGKSRVNPLAVGLVGIEPTTKGL